MSQAKSEWDLDLATGQLTRKLRGAELIVRASELTNNGNFQLNILGEFETNIPKIELRRRCQTSWWLTRQTLPLIGVTLGLEQVFFKPIQSVNDAKLWISETCIFEKNVTCEEVLTKQYRQASDVTKVTVILEPLSGRLGCVVNISHTLTSLDVYQIMDSFVSNLSARECDVDLEQIFLPETATLANRLPQSLGQAYANQHPAITEAEREEAWRIYEHAQERWQRSSIGIPVHPDHETRASLMHNEQATFSAAEVKAALAAAKMQRVTITTLFFACITAGIRARYSDGSEEGAHLVFSGNGQRWLDTRASDTRGPVGMSILPGALWLDRADIMNTGQVKPRDVFEMARRIQTLQNQDLVSKHIIAVYDELAPTAFQAAMESRHQPRAVPRVCRPTLTSQGEFFKQDSAARRESNDAAAGAYKAKLVHFRSGGRNTDSSVCFALFSFRGDMRCNMLFDEKFFDRDEVLGLMDTIMGIFRRVAFSVQDGTLAKF